MRPDEERALRDAMMQYWAWKLGYEAGRKAAREEYLKETTKNEASMCSMSAILPRQEE